MKLLKNRKVIAIIFAVIFIVMGIGLWQSIITHPLLNDLVDIRALVVGYIAFAVIFIVFMCRRNKLHK
jgi:uncharacterized membrane-anchored protein